MGGRYAPRKITQKWLWRFHHKRYCYIFVATARSYRASLAAYSPPLDRVLWPGLPACISAGAQTHFPPRPSHCHREPERAARARKPAPPPARLLRRQRGSCAFIVGHDGQQHPHPLTTPGDGEVLVQLRMKLLLVAAQHFARCLDQGVEGIPHPAAGFLLSRPWSTGPQRELVLALQRRWEQPSHRRPRS